MKIYIENNQIIFDHTDVDPYALLSVKAAECREWLWAFRWQPTGKAKVGAINLKAPSDYSDAIRIWELLADIRSHARRGRGFVELDSSFDDFYDWLNEVKRKFYEDEQRQEAERKKAEEWVRRCKNGCGRCANLKCVGDDYECAATGEDLETKNSPGYRGGVYVLFDYAPFPTQNCPFNAIKTEGRING